MLNSLSSFCLLSIGLLQIQFSFAQKKEENIGTEVVNVVKQYTPTISDVSKIKELPTIDEEENAKKEAVKYAIFSFPVASTFTPYKGIAESVDKVEKTKYLKNYLTFGGGNYGVLNAELFLNQDLNTTDYIGGMFRHFSSQGGIKGVELSDNYNETNIDLTFGTNRKNLSWNLDVGYQNQIYNWYGLPIDFGSFLTPIQRATLINETNVQQSYNTLYVGNRINIKNGVLNDVSLKFNHFSDAFGSAENRFYVKPSFEFNINDRLLNTNVIVDYLKGSFEKNYWNTSTIQYGYTNIGIAPSFEFNEQGWKVTIGAGLFYSLDAETSNNQFLIYPKINASFDIVDNLMVFYTGVDGNLEQNTFADFVNENPFVSLRLTIAPTDKQYDLFAGLKGKLTNDISYNIRGSYINERNKALFKSNEYYDSMYEDIMKVEGYQLGNSFEVVYDDMKTLSFYGELKADLSEKVSFGINGTFNSFTTNSEKEAWNLPTIKLDSKIDFEITEKWYAGMNVFYVGERKDEQHYDTYLNGNEPKLIKSLDGYFDVNAHVGFKYSDRLTAFLRANNITNNSYQKWLNYSVQGLQVVLGVNYKFDF
ncbi:TonB-dependent receptor [Flavobacterium sp.]|uniref:TonB-dependent receptor n=1 Tax=Flavobacterium sp. TaxID=239 RepID=UPI0038FCF56A